MVPIMIDTILYVLRRKHNGIEGFAFKFVDGTTMFSATPTEELQQEMLAILFEKISGNPNFVSFFSSLINVSELVRAEVDTEPDKGTMLNFYFKNDHILAILGDDPSEVEAHRQLFLEAWNTTKKYQLHRPRETLH